MCACWDLRVHPLVGGTGHEPRPKTRHPAPGFLQSLGSYDRRDWCSCTRASLKTVHRPEQPSPVSRRDPRKTRTFGFERQFWAAGGAFASIEGGEAGKCCKRFARTARAGCRLFCNCVSSRVVEVLGILKPFRPTSGSNSVVECQLPKLKVAGSTPVSRSILFNTLRYYVGGD